MDKYAVFKESKRTIHAELSISNNIVNSESIVVLRRLVDDWVNKVLKLGSNHTIYYPAGTANASIKDLEIVSFCSDSPYKLEIVEQESNVRVRLVTYEPFYNILKVR